MQTKNIVIIASLTVVSLMFGLFWVIAPALMKDKVVGLVTFASADRQCFNYYKNKEDYFKDPDSAYIESRRILTKKDNLEELKALQEIIEIDKVLKIKEYDSVVQIKVRARNSMGGYTSDDIYCPLVDKKFNRIDLLRYDVLYSIKKSTEEVELIKEKCTTVIGFSDTHKESCLRVNPDGSH
ncbi:MAG: hypothetical protein Q8L15_17510 [Methylobacter sp.]|nr:hypothetical protein [Methylobacter sp.]